MESTALSVHVRQMRRQNRGENHQSNPIIKSDSPSTCMDERFGAF